MKDKQFGEIKWNVTAGYWEGPIQIDRLTRFGLESYVSRDGNLVVRIETVGGRQSPVAAQREAWQKFVDAMPGLGDEIRGI
jgi:hypothetical protein